MLLLIISDLHLDLQHNNIIIVDNITTTSAFCKLNYLLSNINDIDYCTIVSTQNMEILNGLIIFTSTL